MYHHRFHLLQAPSCCSVVQQVASSLFRWCRRVWVYGDDAHRGSRFR
uniref:Uncharacterized protein n=1 Tax=Arundo donax TaxID=35708 RepID=A0A0A9AUR2_ARUDO